MSSAPASPKRRHILSSINPDEHPERPRKTRRRADADLPSHHGHPPPSPPSPPSPPAAAGGRHEGDDPRNQSHAHDEATTRPRPTRLKLKGQSRKPSRRDDDDDGDDDDDRSASRRHHRHHRHRRRRHHRSPTPPNPHEPSPLDPDAAFRESLFDAMADDEGAAYWESVYGQPVHVYPSTRLGPSGELEQMTEDEYAAHVRTKMWEKTHAGLLEEKARREQARQRKQAEERKERKLREDVERSLRRGEERRARRAWAERWDAYARAWAEWDGAPEGIAWPVVEGRRVEGEGEGGGVREEDVRRFFVMGMGLEGIGEKEFAARLREERVRWHPDKVQQRLGGRRADDEALMGDVTAVFQIIDKLWSEMKS